MKKLIRFSLVLLLILTGCNKKESHEVVTSFFPIQSMVEMITEEKVSVIMDQSGDAHDFEPTAKQRALIMEAKLFLYNGAGFEFWFENNMIKDGKAVALSENLSLLENEDDDHDHDHDHGEQDPHIWLEPHFGKEMFTKIYQELSEAFPDKKELYTRNYQAGIKQIDKIISNYDELNKVENKELVVDHHAYGYLANRYDLHQTAIIEGISDGDASFKETERAIKLIKEKEVKAIFVDPSHKNNVTKLVEKETGAKILDLYTLEKSVENKNYFEMLDYNLEQLLEGLM